MAMINRTGYGIIGVSNSVLSKMIVNNMLEYDEFIIPCSRKGKPLKKGLISGMGEYTNSVEIGEEHGNVKVTIYIISRFGESLSDISEHIFGQIEKDFELLGLRKPSEIKIIIKGVMSKQIAERNIELVRIND